MCERCYLTTVLPPVSSLADIEACLKKVKWTKEGLLHLYDSISYPQTVWVRKKDDCDGFAVLAAALLQQYKPEYKPVLLTALVRPVKKSHTVCVFSLSEGSLGVFDNARLHHEEHGTYPDVASRISKGKGRLLCWDVRKPESFEMIEFHKA
jgi:hypothetical protein